MYKRRQTRAPRALEQTEAMRQRDDLRTRADALALRNTELLLLNQELTKRLRIRDLEIDKLLHDKILLGVELRDVRVLIDFLEGRQTLGWSSCARNTWTSSRKI